MKKIAFLATFVICAYTASSQSFLHGAGVGFMLSDPATPGINSKLFFTLHYYPQVAFVETESFSVSAGIPLTVGLSGSYSANYSTRGDSYEENTLLALAQVPLMINFNGGAGSSKDNEQRFGYFIGGGFGYHTTGIGDVVTWDVLGNEMVKEKQYSKGFGPAANAGVRIAVGSNQKSIEIRLSYMKGMKDYKPAMYGLNAAFNF